MRHHDPTACCLSPLPYSTYFVVRLSLVTPRSVIANNVHVYSSAHDALQTRVLWNASHARSVVILRLKDQRNFSKPPLCYVDHTSCFLLQMFPIPTLLSATPKRATTRSYGATLFKEYDHLPPVISFHLLSGRIAFFGWIGLTASGMPQTTLRPLVSRS